MQNNTQEITTKIVFANKARRQLWRGMKIAAATVGCTLGPKGKTVLMRGPDGALIATKDGVSCSKAIRLKDPVQRMGADLVREAASQTNEVAGDGTTTATVLTAALVEEGMRLVEAGASAREVCAGIERAGRLVGDMLVNGAKKVETSEEIAQVGTISANGDGDIGRLIAGAMERVGRDGIITVEDAKGMATTVDIAEGMQFDRGYLSPYFVTDAERMRAAYEGALVLVTDRKLGSLKDLIPILEAVMREQRALLIIAEDVEGEALQGLVLNRARGGLKVVAIKAPGYGQHRTELLSDICALTGATLVTASTGTSLDKLTVKELGQCKKFVTDAKQTTIVGTGATKEKVDRHVADLRAQLEDVTLSEEDRGKLRVRVAKLANGVAVVRVGGATEVEMTERKYRIEDALNATKAAAEEGIVPGGGTALYACGRVVFSEAMGDSSISRDERAGMEALAAAVQAPMKKIIENAGADFGKVTNELAHRHARSEADASLGYNAATGKYEDLVKAGVIDPVKVTRTALKNAVSVAVTFLNLDAVIVDESPATSVPVEAQ